MWSVRVFSHGKYLLINAEQRYGILSEKVK